MGWLFGHWLIIARVNLLVIHDRRCMYGLMGWLDDLVFWL